MNTEDCDDPSIAAASLPALLRSQARRQPTAELLRYGDQTQTYAEFDCHTDELAAGLADIGVRAGAVVAICMTNRPEYLHAWWAILKLGAAVAHVNCNFTAPEARYVIEDAGATIVIGDESTHPVLDAVQAQVPMLRIVVAGQHTLGDAVSLASVAASGRTPDPVPIDRHMLAGLVYTSGTTGKPKGAMLTHGSYLANAEMLVEAVPVHGGDRLGLVLPLFHANAQVVSTIMPILAGATIALWPAKFSAATFWDVVAEYRPITFSAVPTMLAGLLRAADPSADASSLKFVICGAAPLTPELLTAFEARFGLRILEGYGLTEATCALSVNPYDGDRKVGSIGLPLNGVEMRVLDLDGRPVPDGQIGEIVARGATLMAGYFHNEGATADTLKGGWLHTGDLGYRDPDGYYFLMDRKKDVIIRGGENIYPREIEQVIDTHPAVLESAVISRPHAALGEEPHAVVVLAPGCRLTGGELLAHCAKSLAKQKLPITFEFRTELPKTATGKIQRQRLRPVDSLAPDVSPGPVVPAAGD